MGRLINSNSFKYAIKSESLYRKTPLWDFHVHTNFTDGKNSVEEMVEEALKRKISLLIFTEHTEPWLNHQEDWFKEYCAQINFFKQKYRQEIELKIGIETPATDYTGGLEMNDEMDKHSEFILGAAHRYPGLGNRRVRDLNEQEAINFEYNTLMALAENPKIDAIAHIGATCSKYVESFPEKLTRNIIKTAAKNHIAIEINQQYHQPLSAFINICMEEKAIITLGSNAHRKEDIGNAAQEVKNLYQHE